MRCSARNNLLVTYQEALERGLAAWFGHSRDRSVIDVRAAQGDAPQRVPLAFNAWPPRTHDGRQSGHERRPSTAPRERARKQVWMPVGQASRSFAPFLIS